MLRPIHTLEKDKKYLFLLAGVTSIFLISIIVLSVSSQQKTKQAGITQTQQSTQVVRQETASDATPEKTTEESGFFDIFSFFSKPQSTSNQSATGTTTQSRSQGTEGGETTQTNADASGQTTPQSGKRSSWENAPVTGNGSGTSSQTSQGSTQSSGSTTTSSQSTGTSSTPIQSGQAAPTNTPAPADIQIIFENPNGTTTEYKPPGTPPTEIKWGRYVSYQDHYAIDYPVNWQIDVSVVNGHEGVTLYAPGANRNDPETPYIGFGWSQSYLVAASGSLENAFDTPLLVSNVSGTLYTDGSLGASYIASIFPYLNGYLGLAASNSDVTFSYVYYYMLHSLEFGVY